MKFHEKLRLYREQHEITKVWLSEHVGIPRQTLIRLEKGEEGVFTVDNWKQLQEATGLSFQFWTDDSIPYEDHEKWRVTDGIE